MSTVPQNAKLRLEWWEAHIAQVVANAVAVGTTVEATTDLSTKITTARSKFLAKQEAEGAARTATSEWHSAVLAMGTAGAAIIDSIRSKAKTVGGNSIWELSGIPAPATPTPVGPPGMPTDLKVELLPDGSLKLGWKCVNPAAAGGPIYHLWRSAGNPDNYAFIGGAGAREFTDNTVPSGDAIVYYKIKAIRTTAMGDPAEFMVRFGTGVGGGVSVTALTPKLAA